VSQIYLVQQYPYEDWETIAHFDNVEEANMLCQKLEIAHSKLAEQYNNYRVKAIFDNEINRNFFGVN